MNKIAVYVFLALLSVGSVVSMLADLWFLKWCWYVLQVFLLWVAADFITGVIHWWEDTYGNPKWKILGKFVVEPNLVHHKQPHKLLEGSYWNRINTSFFAALMIGGILTLFSLLTWQVVVCLLFCVQGNQVHAMSHLPDRTTGKFINWLQKTGIFQSKKMHRWHHKAPYETNFCVRSDYVNPILNKIHFWRSLEIAIFKTFRIQVLRASSAREGL